MCILEFIFSRLGFRHLIKYLMMDNEKEMDEGVEQETEGNCWIYERDFVRKKGKIIVNSRCVCVFCVCVCLCVCVCDG